LHFGSQVPLSTLKPYVTTSAPRLSTSCWLDFTGLGISPNYILHAELAHPRFFNYIKFYNSKLLQILITTKKYPFEYYLVIITFSILIPLFFDN